MWAAGKGQAAIVTQLLERGSYINSVDEVDPCLIVSCSVDSAREFESTERVRVRNQLWRIGNLSTNVMKV